MHTHPPILTLLRAADPDTIFSEMQSAGVSWKIYYTDTLPNGQPLTDLGQFWPNFAAQHAANIVPVSQYFTDSRTTPCPRFHSFRRARIRPRRTSRWTDDDWRRRQRYSKGALYVSSLINGLMSSSSWPSSVSFSATTRAADSTTMCHRKRQFSPTESSLWISSPMIRSSIRRLISIRLVSVCR